MNRNPRLILILAASGGAALMTFAALRFYYRRRRKAIEEKSASQEGRNAQKRPQEEGSATPPSAPELRLDPSAESVTKEDITRAHVISSLVREASWSASFDSSDTPSEERLIDDPLKEEDDEEEEDETLEATGFEDDDDENFDRSRFDDDDDVDRSNLDISLPDVPPEGAASILSPTEAEVLVDYLAGGSVKRRMQCLVTIANAASFSANQYLLRRAGCIPVLNDLTMSEDKTVASQAMKALTNLAVNEENQEHMEETVAILVSVVGTFVTSTDVEERRSYLDAELCALQTLTNLTVTDKFHARLTPLMPGLLENVDNCDTFGEFSASILTQTWKILVNLSSNAAVLPSLLACRTPETLLEFLAEASKRTDSSNALRICYFLANIMDLLNKDSLPLNYLVAQPSSSSSVVRTSAPPALSPVFSKDSLYALLCQDEKSSELRTLLLDLTRHSDDNIRQQSTRLYAALFLFWGRKMSQTDAGRKSSPL